MILRITTIFITTAVACIMLWAVAGAMTRQIERTMEMHRNFTAPSAYAPDFYDV